MAKRRSDLDSLFLLDEGDDFAQVADDRFQFRDRFGGEVLPVGEVVARFQRQRHAAALTALVKLSPWMTPLIVGTPASGRKKPQSAAVVQTVPDGI